MAPEVLSNKKYEYAADVWSLGCIFYELLTLRLDRNMYMDVFSKVDFYRDLLKELDELGYSQDMARLIVDMFEIQPRLRVTTEQVLAKIQKMLHGEYSARTDTVVSCEGCEGTAYVECVGCKSYLCNDCFSDSHKFGAMKRHEKIDLDVPVKEPQKEHKKKIPIERAKPIGTLPHLQDENTFVARERVTSRLHRVHDELLRRIPVAAPQGVGMSRKK
jgi:serine/threonine protein kinase